MDKLVCLKKIIPTGAKAMKKKKKIDVKGSPLTFRIAEYIFKNVHVPYYVALHI